MYSLRPLQKMIPIIQSQYRHILPSSKSCSNPITTSIIENGNRSLLSTLYHRHSLWSKMEILFCIGLKRLLPLLSLSILTACGEYDIQEDMNLFSEIDNPSSQEIRLDITPSDASLDILPQSFILNAEESWQDINLKLQPTTIISGDIHGFSIYPYMDTTLPGEDLPVEAQVQISQGSSINGGIVNSDEEGNFSLSIPEGQDYQISVAPLSPQNVPYTIVEGLSFGSDVPRLDIDLGVGNPIYGTIEGFSDAGFSAQVQLIDLETGVKGPQTDISANGYFQVRAPSNRQDFILRVQGEQSNTLPTIDTQVHLEANTEDSREINLSLGDLTPSTVTGQLLDVDGSSYAERSTIRFHSNSLADNEGVIDIETNNDDNSSFTVNLLKGIYEIEIIPPYSETEKEAPVFLTLDVNERLVDLGEIYFKKKITYSAIVLGIDGLPSSNVTVNFKEQEFNEYLYSGKTDDNGRLSILIPAVDMNVSLIPDNSFETITNLSLDAIDIALAEDSELQLPEWPLQSGQPLSGTLQIEDEVIPFALIEVYQGNTLLANGLSDLDGYFSLQIQTEE